jgi:hypothetical protein
MMVTDKYFNAEVYPMKKPIIIISVVAIALLLASCDPAKIGNTLKKTQGNLFSRLIPVDTSSAEKTASAATSAVNKEEGTILPSTKEDKDAFMADVAQKIEQATASEEKQAALQEELSKPVDEDTKIIMQSNLEDLNGSLLEQGINVELELPEEPTVMNLMVMQMVSVVTEKNAEADPENKEEAKEAAQAALSAIEAISSLSKAGQVDVLAIALPYLPDMMEDSKALITEEEITDDLVKYARMVIAIFNEVVKASDSDGDTYLDGAGLADAMFTLRAKRIAYESAGTTIYSVYDKGEGRLKTFAKMVEDPMGIFSLGNMLDYLVCVGMTEFEGVFGSPMDQMLTHTATDAIREYLKNPTKANLVVLVNLEEFSGFKDTLDNFDFCTIINGSAITETSCSMAADVAIEMFNDTIRKILEELN